MVLRVLPIDKNKEKVQYQFRVKIVSLKIYLE